MKFTEWFDNNLRVGRYPLPEECEKMHYDIIVNVSDEYISGCHSKAQQSGKKYFWFPTNQGTSNIGINSVYGALQILHMAEKENKSVYLHCHAGANRSKEPNSKKYWLMGSAKNYEITHWMEIIPPQQCKNN